MHMADTTKLLPTYMEMVFSSCPEKTEVLGKKKKKKEISKTFLTLEKKKLIISQ